MELERDRATRGEGVIKVLVGIVLLVGGLIAGIKVIPVHIHGNEMLDCMNEQANFGSLKPPERIRDAVWMKAQEIHVPLPKQDVQVSIRGNSIVIKAKYEETVDVIFGYKYTYKFDKTVEKPIF